MSSELRVDTIKLANGNTATASSLGIGGVGKILQYKTAKNNTGSDDGGTVDMFYNWDAGRYQRPVKYTYIDTTHNTTSSIVYKFFAGTDAGNTVRFGANTRYSTTEVVEIA
jgi:hypothetical protein